MQSRWHDENVSSLLSGHLCSAMPEWFDRFVLKFLYVLSNMTYSLQNLIHEIIEIFVAWQVSWLISASAAFSRICFPQWLVLPMRCMRFTVAGLLRLFTWFPFNCLPGGCGWQTYASAKLSVFLKTPKFCDYHAARLSRAAHYIAECRTGRSLYFVKGLSEVVNDIVDVLCPYAETHGWWSYVLFFKLFRRQLWVGGGIGVYYQAFHVGNICK